MRVGQSISRTFANEDFVVMGGVWAISPTFDIKDNEATAEGFRDYGLRQKHRFHSLPQ